MTKVEEKLKHVSDEASKEQEVDARLSAGLYKASMGRSGIGSLIGEKLGGATGEFAGRKAGERMEERGVLGSIGSTAGTAVGAAVGGPLGASIGGALGGGVDKILGPITSRVGKAFSALTDPVGTLTSGLQGLQGPLGIIGVIAPAAITNLLGPLTQMAGLASPASLTLFNHALEDTQAVIGRSFVPVLDTMRDGVRLFGDVLASIIPGTGEVNSVLSDMKAAFREFRGSVSEAMGEFGPVIKVGLLVVIKALGDAAAWTMRQLQPLVAWVGNFFRPIREALGLSASAQSSFGAAARPANFSGIDEYQRKLQLAAFSNPGQSPQVTATNEVRVAIDRIYAWLSHRWGPAIVPIAVGAGGASAGGVLAAAGAGGAPVGVSFGASFGQWLASQLLPQPGT